MLPEVPPVGAHWAYRHGAGYRVYQAGMHHWMMPLQLWIYPCCNGFSWHLYKRDGTLAVPEGLGTARLALVAVGEYLAAQDRERAAKELAKQERKLAREQKRLARQEAESARIQKRLERERIKALRGT